MLFYTKAAGGGSVPVEHMRIDLDGNIGIGSTIPRSTLDLTADASWTEAEDLSNYASGGAVVLVAPFTHLRLNVSGGDTEAILRV